MSRYLLVLFTLITFFACSDKYASKIYKDTNSQYRTQAKRYAAAFGSISFARFGGYQYVVGMGWYDQFFDAKTQFCRHSPHRTNEL